MNRKLALVTGAAATVLALAPAAYAANFPGTSSGDRIIGTNRADVVDARGGADLVRSLGGDDRVNGGAGPDRLWAGKGADKVWGGGGRDLIDSGKDSSVDQLLGGPRRDRIFATFDDQVWGGRGDDYVNFAFGSHGRIDCGLGHDTVEFNQPSPDVTLIGCEVVKVVSAG